MDYLEIDKDKLDKTVNDLNMLLANYQVYYQNLRNFHWNVQGHHFFDLHEQFEALYNDAKIKIDEIAERILTLRRRPLSTLKSYLATATINESELADASDMVKEVLKNHASLIKIMRGTLKSAGEANDEGTIDMVAGYLGELEKKIWMLDAWVSKS